MTDYPQYMSPKMRVKWRLRSKKPLKKREKEKRRKEKCI